ncbi:hypothetical protein [Streptomyces erythrochromogenes]|uniref:hypothetical protein n=1 Tax=Streptomyces erythrochromogenes TaxID=285574 RepID=UPI0036BB128C
MTKNAVSVAGRVVVAGLLCAVLAGCGTTRAGQAAPPAGVPVPAPADCGTDVTTDATTDEDHGGYAGPPTDEETGAPAGPPTDEETGGYAGPPTEPETADGGGPCGPADWFDMTRDFEAYHQGHRADRDDDVSVTQTRVRKIHSIGEARITFATQEVGKGEAEDARAIAAEFTRWRREVYGDHGTLTLRTADHEVVTERW